MRLGQLIRVWRESQVPDLSQRELAERIGGLSAAALSHFELMDMKPSWDTWTTIHRWITAELSEEEKKALAAPPEPVAKRRTAAPAPVFGSKPNGKPGKKHQPVQEGLSISAGPELEAMQKQLTEMNSAMKQLQAQIAANKPAQS